MSPQPGLTGNRVGDWTCDPGEARYGCFLPDLTGLASIPSAASLPQSLYQHCRTAPTPMRPGQRTCSGFRHTGGRIPKDRYCRIMSASRPTADIGARSPAGRKVTRRRYWQMKTAARRPPHCGYPFDRGSVQFPAPPHEAQPGEAETEYGECAGFGGGDNPSLKRWG